MSQTSGKTIEKRVSVLENQSLSLLTKNKLEADKYNYTQSQYVNGSELLSFETLPKDNIVLDESISNDFSHFSKKWILVSDKIATSIAVSETGMFQIMSRDIGGIYLSLDYGITWIQIEDFIFNDITYDGSVIYTCVAISSDGRVLTAAGSLGVIISLDFGNTWTVSNEMTDQWISLGISTDGKIQYISNINNTYYSKDYGKNWIFLYDVPSKITCSSNGRYLSKINYLINDKIYYSNNYGSSLGQSDSPSKEWVSIKCSSTGQYQTAISNDNSVYISYNYGINWVASNSVLYESLTDISISGSGKYQLIISQNLYVSRNYGKCWRNVTINDVSINCCALSFDGKIAMLSSDSIFESAIITKYIKEIGNVEFKALDKSLFATTFNSNSNNLSSEIPFRNSVSKTGQYQTIITTNGHLWTSNDFGETFNSRDDVENWSSLTLSDSGQNQFVTTYDGIVYKSDDYGLNWSQVFSNISFTLNDIKTSESGKYVTIVCNSGIILYSADFGITWINITVTSENLASIAMSKNGKYQSICGANGTNMYSKTYGMNWKYSNLPNNGTQWKSISSSSDGQYQSICGMNDYIYVSEDYGVNWSSSSSIVDNWLSICVSFLGQQQITYDNTGNIYVSLDFGYTWNICYTNVEIPLSLVISDTLQYIIILYSDITVISKIDNDGFIPGIATVKTNAVINNNGVILLSGSNNNTYSYNTNFTDEFNIISSNMEDDGVCSYEILFYGQDIN